MYLEGFESVQDVFGQFDVRETEGIEILVAVYEQGDYDGSAYVFFRKEGKLYEVTGGHCSCNGLEGQWEPEETDAAALLHRMKEGTYFNRYSSQVVQEIENSMREPDSRWDDAERWANDLMQRIRGNQNP